MTSRLHRRIAFAVRIIVGRYPLPSPQQELNMSAIDNLNTAIASVTAYVTSLQGDLAGADMTPQIEAATAALNALVPAPVVVPAVDPAPVAPVLDPATGQQVEPAPAS